MKSTQKLRAERRAKYLMEIAKPCECRACHALKFEHGDVHLRNNKPSPWCYECRKDFTKEEIEEVRTNLTKDV